MTRAVVKPLPVYYACQGCEEFGQRALEYARGRGQVVWLGAPEAPLLRERFPIYAVDGCDKGCARRWLERHGVKPDRSFVIM